MEEEKNRTSDILEENDENILKQEIKFIQEEFKNKIEEYKKLKEELKNVKKSFHDGLEDYTTKKNSTIEKEQEIEGFLSKISKMRKMMMLSINQTINKKFYTHLLEISNNKQKENILLKYFNYLFNVYNYNKIYINNNSYNSNKDNNTESNINNNSVSNINNNNTIVDNSQSIQELITIIRNEAEIKNILFYSYDIFHNLQEENSDMYLNIKNSFLELYNEINSIERQYPFDFLFDYLKNIFDVIDYEKQVESLKDMLNKLTQEKNAKFVEVKNIESVIKKYNRIIKIISNYKKALKTFYYRIIEHNKKNNKENNNNEKDKENNKNEKNKENNSKENNNKNNNNILRDLIDDIEKFKKITLDYDKINSNFDVMTSLSFGTNYTLSEKSSIKSSSFIDYINNNIDNEYNIDVNCNNNSNEVINKDLNMNIVKKNNHNMINNILKKNEINKNNKMQKKSVGNKTLNLKINNTNENTYNMRKRKNIKKKISLSKHNAGNLTTIIGNNINNNIQINRQLNSKSPINNNKKIQNKSNNISYTKDKKKLNKSKLNNNSKNNINTKINGQNLLNKDIKKGFNTNKNNKYNNINKKLSPNLKSCINIKNNNQKFESNNINIKNKKYKIENIVSENVKEIKNDNIFEIVLNYSLPRTVKIHG